MPDDRYILSPFKERKPRRNPLEAVLMLLGLGTLFALFFFGMAWLFSGVGG